MKTIKGLILFISMTLLCLTSALSQNIAKEVAGRYVGKLTVTLFGEPTANEGQEIEMEPVDDNHIKFAIYNFQFTGNPVGDIVLPSVPISKAPDGTISFKKAAPTDILLAEGAIKASASIDEKTSKINGDKMTVDVKVVWHNEGADIDIPVHFEGDKHSQPVPIEDLTKNIVGKYNGLLHVELNGLKNDIKDSKVNLERTSDNTVKFALYNFKMDSKTPIGDIVLPHIPIIKDGDGNIKFGANNPVDLTLNGGQIKATAKINESTSFIKGNRLYADVTVLWINGSTKTPITTIFDGVKDNGTKPDPQPDPNPNPNPQPDPQPQPHDGVFQIPNQDFETTWVDTNEPGHGWNSFVSANTTELGGLGSMAKNMSKGNTSSTEGYNSKTAVKLTSSSIFGTKANGNLTTGRINMGAQSPKDPKNYNYTDLKSDGNKLLFAGKPDVITFYAKYKRGENGNYNGQLKAILHDKISFKDPAHGEEKVLMDKHILGQTTVSITPSADWTRFEGEFKYSKLQADTTYMLVNVTTNPIPGATSGDELILDNVTFVYRSELKEAQLGKAKLTIPNNGEISTSDYRYDPTMIKLISNGQGATVKTSFDKNQDLLTIEVIGNDISINPNNKHIYKFKFNKNGITPEPADPSEEESEEEGIDAAYQVPNSDFERDWTDKNEPGNGWYSYVSANATELGWKGGIAINNSKGNTQKLTPGHNSKTAVKIVSKWMFFTNVNGNLTTGRIHMGESNPAGHNNYNYTDLKSDNYQLLFAGRPDSLVFYAKYKRGGKGNYGGQLRAFLHDKIEFKDPAYNEEKEQLKKHILSETVVDIMPSNDWVRYEKAIAYTNLKADSSYMLINLFTNPTPGATTGDELDFDDFRFVYNSELSKITYDGEDIDIPAPGQTSYVSAIYDYEKIDFKTNAYAAKVKKSFDPETNILTITVLGGDYKVNKDNKHEYKLRFRKPHPDIATYQLPNGNFEEKWDNTNEPGDGWYSYASANTKQLGTKAKEVKSALLNKLVKTEGYKSATAVMLLDKGNMTTGRIHLGSEDLASPDNYNYTDRASDNHLLFKGQPDSIAFYAKYIDSEDDNSFGEIKAILHQDVDFRDPSEDGQEEYKVAEAKAKIASQPQWKRYSQPFVYTNHQPGDKKYMLLSAINHSEGNEGNKGKLILDNIVFVYNSELSKITYDNEDIAIPKNGETVKIRKIYDPEKLDISTNAKAAKVETQIDSNSAILTVTIKGNDIESNPENKHVYKFQFRQPKENIANFQMPNGGFEENWEEANEPGNGWYSIVSANAIDETGVAFKQSTLRNTIKTEGYKSATAILLQNNSILTTGRINLASSDYNSNQNYCYTERNSENHLLFQGQPDAISFYAKFAKEGEAVSEVKAILHGDTDYRDPADEAVKEAQKEYKIAESSTTINPSNDWTKYSIPFVYSDNNRKEKSYMLIKASIQSEQTAKLALDDFVFVYNSELKTFEYDGKAMPISKTDTIKIEGSYNPDKVGRIETNAHAATLSIDYDRDTNELSIYIYGNDFVVNKNNYHTYVYQFEQGEGIDNVRPYSNKKVNVYSIDGILIKKNVTKDLAIKDLPNGIYIIGNEKVVIK